jgi:hypothetical protein
MAITITSGAEQRYKVGGIDDQNQPAPLDPNTPLALTFDGSVQIKQSVASFDEVIVGAPPGTVTGPNGQLHINQADADMGPGVTPLSLDVDTSVTSAPTRDARTVGFVPVGAETPFGTQT